MLLRPPWPRMSGFQMSGGFTSRLKMKRAMSILSSIFAGAGLATDDMVRLRCGGRGAETSHQRLPPRPIISPRTADEAPSRQYSREVRRLAGFGRRSVALPDARAASPLTDATASPMSQNAAWSPQAVSAPRFRSQNPGVRKLSSSRTPLGSSRKAWRPAPLGMSRTS